MNIPYGLDSCLALLSVEGQKGTLAFTLLQLLCTVRRPSPFVQVLSAWPGERALLTAWARSSRGEVLSGPGSPALPSRAPQAPRAPPAFELNL